MISEISALKFTESSVLVKARCGCKLQGTAHGGSDVEQNSVHSSFSARAWEVIGLLPIVRAQRFLVSLGGAWHSSPWMLVPAGTCWLLALPAAGPGWRGFGSP